MKTYSVVLNVFASVEIEARSLVEAKEKAVLTLDSERQEFEITVDRIEDVTEISNIRKGVGSY